MFTGDSDDTQYSTPRGGEGEVEVIDLRTPETSPQGSKPLAYIPRTLKYEHQPRFTILPLFPVDPATATPTVTRTRERLMGESLLLANVPQEQLSIQQAARRRLDYYPPPFSIESNVGENQSFLKQKYQLFFESLMGRFQVGLKILDYNYIRLQQILRLYNNIRLRFFNNSNRSNIVEWQIEEEEYPALLEFYLQFDVDLFYMKTCSFGQAQPRSTVEGLFCLQPPECRYTMKSCGNCELCCSSPSTIQFDQYQRHRFVNGYESILNCPATCSTQNIIYVLTCPCGQYDYIGESSQSLAPCVRRHRQLSHQFLHEFLIGETNRQRVQGIPLDDKMGSKRRMRLYQHTIRCSVAIQLFLNRNPHYWPFIPIHERQVSRQNSQSSRTTSLIDRDQSIEQRMKLVPDPPKEYQFTYQQLAKQYDYFAMKLDQKLPNERSNLYKAKIIAVLPINASDSFRQIIHALFVTHAETKLNTMGQLFYSHGQTDIQMGIWCENLNRS